MTFGLVNASFSLPKWQGLEMTFFAPCVHVCYVCRSVFHLSTIRVKKKIIAIVSGIFNSRYNQSCYKLHALISKIILCNIHVVYTVPVKNAPISKLHHSIQTMAIPDTASLINCDQFNKLSVVQPKWQKLNSCIKHYYFFHDHALQGLKLAFIVLWVDFTFNA